jgi:hypothetical protein
MVTLQFIANFRSFIWKRNDTDFTSVDLQSDLTLHFMLQVRFYNELCVGPYGRCQRGGSSLYKSYVKG